MTFTQSQAGDVLNKRKLAYLDRGEGSCRPANRDVVKLEVDFYCKKKPPRFPFPAKTNQAYDLLHS